MLLIPRGLVNPFISVSRAWRVPMPPPPPIPPMMIRLIHERRGWSRRLGRLLPDRGQGLLGERRQIVESVAGDVGRNLARSPHATGGRAHVSAAAKGVGLVEEDDDAAVAQRELSELPVQGLDLEDANAHEHVDEGARIDEDIGSARLAGDGLGHQCLSGSGRSPQQDAAGDVSALGLDLVRLLEEGDVLLDQIKDVILSPYVVESGLDLLGHDHAHAPAGEEPEDHHELPDGDRHDHDDLEELRARDDGHEQLRGLGDGLHR